MLQVKIYGCNCINHYLDIMCLILTHNSEWGLRHAEELIKSGFALLTSWVTPRLPVSPPVLIFHLTWHTPHSTTLNCSAPNKRWNSWEFISLIFPNSNFIPLSFYLLELRPLTVASTTLHQMNQFPEGCNTWMLPSNKSIETFFLCRQSSAEDVIREVWTRYHW